jgi:hypothetical protein
MADGQENMEATTVTASTTTTSTSTQKQARKIRSSKAPSHRLKALASSSCRTPKQVNAFHAELNEGEKKKTKAYEWAVNQARLQKRGGKMINVAQVAREASELFNEDVKADTIRLYLCS